MVVMSQVYPEYIVARIRRLMGLSPTKNDFPTQAIFLWAGKSDFHVQENLAPHLPLASDPIGIGERAIIESICYFSQKEKKQNRKG